MNKFFLDIDYFNPKSLNKSFKNNIESFGFSDVSAGLKPKIKDYTLDNTTKMWHLTFILCLVILIGMVFVTRAFYLQIFQGDKYFSLSESNNTRYTQIQAERGVIYSNSGEVLVRNKPAFSIEMNTMYCRQLDICNSTIFEIEKTLNRKLPQAYLDLANNKHVITLEKGLSKEQVIPIETKMAGLPGVIVSVQPLRDYLFPESFSHVLGYIGLDENSLQPKYVGKTGIEKKYEEYIQGIPGERIIKVDSSGSSYKVIAEQNSLPGKNIHTYLNIDLQNKAYELLKKKVDEKKASAGVVVAQDPKTGGILALVNYPSFNSNKLSYGMTNEEMDLLLNADNFPFFNRAIAAVYPPGSTFKMVTASAALTENIVTPSTLIFDPGYIQVGSYIFKNWKPGGHGDVSLVKALQVSNDTYFYTVGGGHGNIKGLGIAKLALWAKKFGYGSLTGIDLDGEVPGYMPDGTSRDWYLGDTYITSIGQGDVLSTPLQVNNVTVYFANGGNLMKPFVVKSVDGIGVLDPVLISKDLVDSKNFELVREGMKAVASPGGTAYPLFDFPQRHNGIGLGAKTGTSEYTDPSGEEKTHAWLTVFGPFEDSTIALTVFLEGGGAGSDDATPIAKELMDTWFTGK